MDKCLFLHELVSENDIIIDSNYALFTIVESVKLIQQQKGKHGRIVVTIESGEEDGSPDLVPYLKKLNVLRKVFIQEQEVE